jgi:hypothetical protein
MKKNRAGMVLVATVAGIELIWFWAGLDLLSQKVRGRSLSIFFLLCFYPLAFLLYRMLRGSHWNRTLLAGFLGWTAAILIYGKEQFFGEMRWMNAEWLGAFGGAFGQVFHSLNAESLAVLSSAVLWGLGWRLAAVKIHFSTLLTEFQFGLSLLLVLFLLDSLWGTNSAFLIPLTLAFFFVALSGIAVSHALERESWLSSPFRNGWLGFLVFSIVLILGAGWMIGRVIDPPLVEFLLSLLAQAGQWILDILAKFFLFLSSLFSLPKGAELPSPTPLPQMKRPDEFPFQIFSESVREVIRFIWAMIWGFLILLALWRLSSQFLDWFRRKWGGMQGVEVEPLPGAFREDLLDFLKRLFLALGFKWFFRKRKEADPLLPAAALVRKTYRQLSAWAAKKGHARNPAQTPYEYLQRLVAWLPEKSGDFAFITERYVRTRYSQTVPTGKEVEELRQRWERVRHTRFKKGPLTLPSPARGEGEPMRPKNLPPP